MAAVQSLHMSVIVSQVTGKSTVCWMHDSVYQQRNFVTLKGANNAEIFYTLLRHHGILTLDLLTENLIKHMMN